MFTYSDCFFGQEDFFNISNSIRKPSSRLRCFSYQRLPKTETEYLKSKIFVYNMISVTFVIHVCEENQSLAFSFEHIFLSIIIKLVTLELDNI